MLSAKKQLSSDFMDAVTVCSDLEPKKRKSVASFTFSPSISHAVMGLDVIILGCIYIYSLRVTISHNLMTIVIILVLYIYI